MRLIAKILTVSILIFAFSAVFAQTKKWTSTTDFDAGVLTQTSDTKFADQIILGSTAVSKMNVIWSDNFNYGLVVKLDTITGKQTARYDSVLNVVNGTSTGVRPANEVCNWANTGNCPGRVAVEANGDAWIVNRAFGSQGSITRIASDISRCIDRNGNGIVDTSTDINGDGIIDMNTANGEYLGQNDECILTTIPVGAINSVPRGITIDRRGKVWVGNYNDKKLYRFNMDTLTLEETVTLTINPYTISSGGDYIFVSSNSASTVRVNITTLTVDSVNCPASYAVVGDPSGTKAWLGTWSSGANGMFLADFSNHTCTTMNNGNNGATTAVTLDTQAFPGPYVWTANYNNNTISKFTTSGTYIGTYPGGGTARPHGLSVDFQGRLWVVNDTANNQMMMSKVNPATGALLGAYSIGFLASDAAKYPAVGGSYSDPASPYIYGDLTGVQLDRQAPYSKEGSWDGVYDGGREGIPWSKVEWNTEPTGAVPVETSLKVSVRAANSVSELGTAVYVFVSNGASFTDISGRYIQVKVEFAGPGFITPVLSDITVFGPCSDPGNDCCIQNTDCTDDDNLCTAETCSIPGGSCTNEPIEGCCLTDADCDDINPCTVDSCDMFATWTCIFDPGNAGAECRVLAGDCDVAEFCTGTEADCPDDILVEEGTECRGLDGDCDIAEKCTGLDAACPEDKFATVEMECRAIAGECDIAENCTGASAQCPEDLKSEALCRDSVSGCDASEYCNGSDVYCPTENYSTVNGNTCDDSSELTENDSCFNGDCNGELKLGVCGNAIKIDALPYTEENTTVDRPNTLNGYGKSCVYDTQPSADIVYELVVEEGVEYQITVTPEANFDATVNLIDECIENKVCIGKSDNGTDGVPEVIIYTADHSGSVFIVVEGYSTGETGRFEISVSTSEKPDEDTVSNDDADSDEAEVTDEATDETSDEIIDESDGSVTIDSDLSDSDDDGTTDIEASSKDNGCGCSLL